MKRIVLCLLLTLPLTAGAVENSATAKQEIEHLIGHLAASGCQFNRNGSWYDSSRAVSHLQRKYEYLLKRNLAPSAEAFIERAASESSASGKPYYVRCGDRAQIESAVWFRDALAKFRASGGKSPLTR
jgi:hypothetical protein